MAKDDDTKLFAFLGILLTVVGFIIVFAARKHDKYAMFYAKQGLVMFVGWVLASILWIIPILGWILGGILWVIMLVLWIIGIFYSLSGEERDVPIIGNYARMIKL